MGYDLLQSPIVQLYLLILGAAFFTVIWESTRDPPAPKDRSPAESGPSRRTAWVRGELPDSGAWALREGPPPADGKNNEPGQCRGSCNGRMRK
jgi:hypothetical protein